jgi:hypothetical protein
LVRDIIQSFFQLVQQVRENLTFAVTGEGTVVVPADAVTIIATVEGENENLTLAEERSQDKDIFCAPSHVITHIPHVSLQM